MGSSQQSAISNQQSAVSGQQKQKGPQRTQRSQRNLAADFADERRLGFHRKGRKDREEKRRRKKAALSN
jgi:hypothetical protein